MLFVHKSHTQFNISVAQFGTSLGPLSPAIPMPNEPENPEPHPESGTKVKAFLTGMIVAASALVGGLAVVLWNRKTLSGLRQQADSRKGPSKEPDDEEE
jgi:hypothetical protein